MFLNNYDVAAQLSEEDVAGWIRRYDLDADGGLRFGDLVNALQTMTNYQRPEKVAPSRAQLTEISKAREEHEDEMALINSGD